MLPLDKLIADWDTHMIGCGLCTTWMEKKQDSTRPCAIGSSRIRKLINYLNDEGVGVATQQTNFIDRNEKAGEPHDGPPASSSEPRRDGKLHKGSGLHEVSSGGTQETEFPFRRRASDRGRAS